MNLTESANSTVVPSPDEEKPGWLFVLPWFLRLVAGGGVNEVVKALIHEFRNDGKFCPHLLVSSEAPESGPVAGPEVIQPFLLNLWSPINHERPVRGLISFLYRLPFRCWALRRILTRHNIRVINPHFPGLECLTFIILKKLGLFKGQIVLSFHNSDVTNALRSRGFERQLWRILLRHADRIVSVSNTLAPDLLAIEPTIKEKIRAIYNGVDLALFASANQVEAHLTQQHAGPTVISVASFLPIKGHDVLLRAFSNVAQKIPSARLLLVGHDGPAFPKVRALIAELSMEDRVFMFKDISHDRIPGFLAQAQLFVLASHREGHPLAIMEAGAAGLPIVCTRAIGSVELISDRVTGRIVDVGDEHALAQAMIELLTSPAEAKRMAARFHEFIKNDMTWRRTYEKYIEASCR